MKRKILVVAILFFMSGVCNAEMRYTITDLHGLGGERTAASSINDLGQVVGVVGSSDWHGFFWDYTTGMRDIGILGGPSWGKSEAYDINNAGQVVGGSCTSDNNNHAFLWGKDIMTDLGTFGGEYSEARFINNPGQIIVVASTVGVGRLILYDKGVVNNIGNILNNYDWILGGVRAINNNGQILGTGRKTADPGGVQRPFILDNLNGLIDLSNDLNKLGNYYKAFNFNDNGQIAGIVSPSGYGRLFLWDKTSGMCDLGSFGGIGEMNGFSHGLDFHTGPWSINNVGQIVGSLPAPGEGHHAFLWDNAQGLMDLNDLIPADSGWTLSIARDINNRGQIVGEGWNSKYNDTHAFLLTPRLNPISQKQQNAVLETPLGNFNSHYNVEFVDDSLRINLSIRLIGIDPGEELRQIWKEGIERIWNNQYNIVSVAGEYPIVLDMEFVDSGGDATIRVVPGEGVYFVGVPGEWYTDSVFSWGPNYRDECAAHEVGHLLGLYDEYDKPKPGVLDPLNPIIDYTSIMGSLDGAPKERHFQSILEWLEGETGYDMVLAQSPLWRPGEFGPPVNDGSPIPEPGSIIFLILGSMAIVFRRRYQQVR